MLVFFFSSRRRHTRFDCDWSSDVCSSDLSDGVVAGNVNSPTGQRAAIRQTTGEIAYLDDLAPTPQGIRFQQIYDISDGCVRSEERRVGKECRSRWPQ